MENQFHHNSFQVKKESQLKQLKQKLNHTKQVEILFISSYPPRECGIATYSKDLILALNKKFNTTFTFKVAALETNHE